MSVQNVKKWQSSGKLKWPWGLPWPLLKVGTNSPEGPLQVSSVCLFLGSKVWEMGEAENCPHPREPLSGTTTAQIGGWEMIVLWVPYNGPVFL